MRMGSWTLYMSLSRGARQMFHCAGAASRFRLCAVMRAGAPVFLSSAMQKSAPRTVIAQASSSISIGPACGAKAGAASSRSAIWSKPSSCPAGSRPAPFAR